MPMEHDFTYPSVTEIRYKTYRFLITDSPDDENIQSFIETFLKYGVTALVRVSEETYDSKLIEAAGIKFYHLEYPDGSAPDSSVRKKWLNIVKENKNGCIAVHCIHGLGRSPVLVAMALREAGMNPQESIDFVRKRRRGSFNIRQLEFLQKYHSDHRLIDKHVGCVIILFIKSGAACQQARSLWRIECFKIKWYSGFVGWSSLVRLRHITSGLYLAVITDENGPKVTRIPKKNASPMAITFEMKMSKEKQVEENQEEDNLGVPTIKYGETIVFIRHVDSDLWISYETLELTIKGIGKVEEKRIIPAIEGHMDDCFRLVRAQEEEQKTALVIRICNAILGRFNRNDSISFDSEAINHLLSKSDVIQALLHDLIGFFSQPSSSLDHEERQLRLKILRNRQDLFQEEGMIRILIAAINFFSERRDKSTLLEGVDEKIEDITNKLYVVLAALIKGNRINCSNFAQSARLNWLVNRLQSQQASSGVLEVLHSVLVDSPEVLNMITESHILAIIGLLDRNGRDPKVLDVLCSLCVNNGVAVRANQNLICENLLQRRDLLLHTALVDHVTCMRPNIVVGVEDGESMYKKWYFEVVIDHIEQVTHVQPHIRIGWATTHFQPSPGHGDGFSSNGIGDNTYSYGFDGQNIWFAGRAYDVSNTDIKQIGFKKNDVIGCLLDLDIPEMWFSLNGLPVKGLIREFNLTGMFYPAISLSSRVSCRFIFGGEHGRFMHRPPEDVAPLYEAMLIKQKVCIEPCFSFGNIERNCLNGPSHIQHNIAFTPQPVRTNHIVLPSYLENICDKLAMNTHELWCMNKIANGWRFGEFRDDTQKTNPCLTSFENLPSEEKKHNQTTIIENLKSLLAFGYHIGMEIKTDDRRLKYIKLPNTYVQTNGYKPQPLDLSNVNLSTKMDDLIELLAENTHNVWAAARIKDGFTYGVSDVEPSTKLYPAVFVEPTVKEVLQFELGRIKNCLPLTAALFPSLNREERFIPQLPSRLHLQSLVHCHWSRVPNTNIRCQQLKLSEIRGWSVFVEDPVQMEAVYIPEEDQCTDILSLVENEDNLNFCSNTLRLYNALCAQGNNRVSHEICKFVDEKQLMYCVKNPYLCGPIRIGIYNLLIALHFESHIKARSLTSTEFIIPLSDALRKSVLLHPKNTLEQQQILATSTYIPAMEQFLAVRPKLIKEEDFKVDRERKLLVPPPFNVLSLKEYIMNSLTDAIEKSSGHLRDPTGGTYANWLVPLLQLVDAFLVMGTLEVNDIQQLLRLIDPTSFGLENEENFTEGLLQMILDEPVKLQLCHILQHLCDYQLQYRIESIIAFSEEFVGKLQADQKRRYQVLKESSLPPALMAKKTREFRCPPKDQMQALLNFKNDLNDMIVFNEDIEEEIKEMLKNFHSNLLILQQVVETNPVLYQPLKINEIDKNEQISLFSRLLEILIRHAIKQKTEENIIIEKQLTYKSGKTLCEVIKETVIKWGRITHFNDPNLIREMFKLIYNQYDGIQR
ncbi:unnamed protein product, partial [Rotaria sp. Silwood1]